MAQAHPNTAYGRMQGPSVTASLSPYQEDDARGGEAETFARAVIFTICSIGVPAHQARRTYERCMAALVQGGTARMGFRNPSRADAIDAVWRERVAWLETLPGIGPVMKHRLNVALDLFDESDLAGDATTEERTGVVTNAS